MPAAAAPRDLSRTARWLEAALDAARDAGRLLARHFEAPTNLGTKADGSAVSDADREAEALLRERLARATPGFGVFGEEYGAEGDPDRRWILDPLDGTTAFLDGLPHFAVLIALELDGVVELGVVHAPLLSGPPVALGGRALRFAGRTWCATRGGGAFAGPGTDPRAPGWRRLALAPARSLEGSLVLHGDLARFARRGTLPLMDDLARRCDRLRGYGDWWGHVLVAEGRAQAMVDPEVQRWDVAALEPILAEAGGALRVLPAADGGGALAVSGRPEQIDAVLAGHAAAHG